MVEMKGGRALFALALVLMPLSYATKLMLQVPDMTWVNPTLVLSIVITLIYCWREKFNIFALLVVGAAFISALIGIFFCSPEDLYSVFREPVRLLLNILWFMVCIWMIRMDRRFVIKWLSISVSVQIFIAVWLFLAWYDMTWVPDPVRAYIDKTRLSQVSYLGSVAFPRLSGTFTEGPPFGLFMLSAFFIFFLAKYVGQESSIWINGGLLFSSIGILGALSDQIFLALVVALGIVLLFRIKIRKFSKLLVFFVTMLLAITPFAWDRVQHKLEQMGHSPESAYGTSFGERAFHARNGLRILSDNPARLLFGIGPGRYGEYAKEEGVFPVTVTPQVTAIEWIVGYGVFGFFFISIWIASIASSAFKNFGKAGVGILLGLLLANGFQANWLWESWFLAMAFLSAGRGSAMASTNEGAIANNDEIGNPAARQTRVI